MWRIGCLTTSPARLKTRGKPIVNIPYTQECNDVAMMLIQHHKASEYYDRAMDQFEQIYADAEDSARVMAIVVHPYIMGAPHRLKYFRNIFAQITEEAGRCVHDRRADFRLVHEGRAEGAVAPSHLLEGAHGEGACSQSSATSGVEETSIFGGCVYETHHIKCCRVGRRVCRDRNLCPRRRHGRCLTRASAALEMGPHRSARRRQSHEAGVGGERGEADQDRRVIELGACARPDHAVLRHAPVRHAHRTHIHNQFSNMRGSNEEIIIAEIGQVGTQFDGFAHQTHLNSCTIASRSTRT